MRGDLIEVFKIIRGFVNYGQNMFKLSRSGLNLISKGSNISKNRRDFFSERVVKYWNNLPNYVKLSTSINNFKVNLAGYKDKCIENIYSGNTGNYWEVSEKVLSRIESPSYLSGRPTFMKYLEENPFVARKKGINVYKST